MQRRNALKLLFSAAALPILGRDLFAFGQQAHSDMPPSTSAPSARLLFNPHQDATVTAIAEAIIPQTETPGAKATRVNEFIDLILAEWVEDSDRKLFLDGLANVDLRCQSLFAKNFIDCSPLQQTDILTDLDAEAAQAREKRGEVIIGRGEYAGAAHFFEIMKRLTLLGYYTSEPGARQELHWNNHFSTYEGCAPIEIAPAPAAIGGSN